MFCEKCGKPVEGQQALCDECAAAQASAVPVEEPAQAEETFVLNTPEAEPENMAPGKKKKGGLIAVIAALAALAAIAVGLILFNDTVGSFVDRTFKSPEAYLRMVESNAIEEFGDELTKSYSQMLNGYDADKTAADMDIRLTLSSDALDLAENALQQQGTVMELDWLSDILLSVDTNVQGEAMQMMLGLSLGETKLLSLDTVFDMANGMLFMTVPEVSRDYLGGSMGEELPAGMLDASYQAMDSLVKALPSEKDMDALLNTYVEILLSGIDNVEKKNDRISIGEASQKVVVLTARITHEDMLRIVGELLEKAQTDKTLEQLLDAYSDYMNALSSVNSYYYEPVDLHQALMDTIPALLEDLAEAKDAAEDGNYLMLTVYVDMQGEVRGHAASVYSDGEKQGETILWVTAVDGDVTYLSAELGTVAITGKIEEIKNASSGEIALEVDGKKCCDLEFENMTEGSGTLRFIPSEELMDEMLSGSGIPASLFSGNVALELTCGTQNDETVCEIKLLVGSESFACLELSTKASEGGNITIPTSWADLNDQDALVRWFKGADLEALVTAMENTAIPQELVDAVSSYIEMLRYYLG